MTDAVRRPHRARKNSKLTYRCGHDGLVSVRTCVDLQVENWAAILSPYDGRLTSGTVRASRTPDKKSSPRHLSSSSKDYVSLGCTSTPALTKFGPCPLVLSLVNRKPFYGN
ncbi:hypothetical protein J6590_072444 [Homalodisca vitripennis]|nr:hypothetical protein J6590_072444 [Homalodisca vitripennis]